ELTLPDVFSPFRTRPEAGNSRETPHQTVGLNLVKSLSHHQGVGRLSPVLVVTLAPSNHDEPCTLIESDRSRVLFADLKKHLAHHKPLPDQSDGGTNQRRPKPRPPRASCNRQRQHFSFIDDRAHKNEPARRTARRVRTQKRKHAITFDQRNQRRRGPSIIR